MKSFALRRLRFLRALAGVALVVGGVAASEPGAESPPTTPAVTAPASSDAAPTVVAPPAKDRTPPPRARAEAPVSFLGGEIVKMARAGVGTEVIRAYVERSTIAAPPRAEEIVYLHECGVSAEVVTALIKRAGELRAAAAQASASLAPQGTPYAPAPTVALQPAPPVPAQVIVQQPVYVYPPQPAPVTYAYAYPRYVYANYPAWGYGWPSVGWSGGFHYRSGFRYGHWLPRQFYAPVRAYPGRGPWAAAGGRFGGRFGGHRR